MRRPSPRSRRRALAALTAGLLLALPACGGEDEETPESQPVEGGAELAALWPLTGEPVESDTPEHPVMVVKIDNSASSAPQVGLGEADIVTEELVEGGTTRLAAMFYQQLPREVGPVRSMRATDIGIVKPALGVLVASGGAPQTVQRLARSQVPVRTEEQGPGWSRDGSRSAPYNLMLDLREAASALTDEATVPASYLPWGSADDLPAGQPARQFDAVFSRSHTTSWRFSDGQYVNENSFSGDDDTFTPDQVLVLRVRQNDAGYLDPAGNTVPESVYEGRGPAVLFHGGTQVRATWVKEDRQTPLTLRTPDGELPVPAGNTWIELLPRDADGGRLSIG